MATELPKLSRPAVRALNAAGISSLEELATRTEKEIKSVHGMGPNALGKLKEAMLEQGLAFRSE